MLGLELTSVDMATVQCVQCTVCTVKPLNTANLGTGEKAVGVMCNMKNPHLGLENGRQYWEGGGIKGYDCTCSEPSLTCNILCYLEPCDPFLY